MHALNPCLPPLHSSSRQTSVTIFQCCHQLKVAFNSPASQIISTENPHAHLSWSCQKLTGIQTLEWNPGSQGILIHLCRAGLHSKVAPLPVMHEAHIPPTSTIIGLLNWSSLINKHDAIYSYINLQFLDF